MLESTLSTAFTDLLVDFASCAADLARAETMPRFRQNVDITNKLADAGSFDPVTDADRAAEAAIRNFIEEAYPDHEIEGEEYGLKETGSDFRWVLDPIDGTRAFISGLPSWGTLIALKYQGKPLIGVIDQPVLKERYIGACSWATLNGKPINTRRNIDLSGATLSTTDPYLFEDSAEKNAFEALRQQVQLTRYGLDCYAYARLAAGGFDVVLESGLQPYDLMALIPVVEGAGGVFTDWAGKQNAASDQVLALGDPALLDPVVALIEAAHQS